MYAYITHTCDTHIMHMTSIIILAQDRWGERVVLRCFVANVCAECHMCEEGRHLRCSVYTCFARSSALVHCGEEGVVLRCSFSGPWAVITVPAYFSDAQRQSANDAGAISGKSVLCGLRSAGDGELYQDFL